MADEKTTEVTVVDDDDTFTISETEEKTQSYNALVAERATLVENQTAYQTRIDKIDVYLAAFDSAKTEAAKKAAAEAAEASESSESEDVDD